MLFYNANIFTPNGYVSGGFEIKHGRFSAILPGLQKGDGIDLDGAKVIPGLVSGITQFLQYLIMISLQSFTDCRYPFYSGQDGREGMRSSRQDLLQRYTGASSLSGA